MTDRRTLVLDLEADNLLPLATTIWCVCTKLLETGEERTFYDKDAFTEYISEVEPTHVVMHNGLGFDLECLYRVWEIPYTVGREPTFGDKPVVWVDTLLLSRFLNADRIGGHSLEAWGERLGFPKGSHSDWSQLSDEMVKYCQQDVRVTERVLHSLQQEVEEYER